MYSVVSITAVVKCTVRWLVRETEPVMPKLIVKYRKESKIVKLYLVC